MSKATDIGRQGEFLAAYILETHGVEVHHVDRAGADLWCKTNTGIVTVQVKTCTSPKLSNERSKPAYAFYTPQSTANYFAFVALDRELLILKPNTPHTTKNTTRLAVHEFNPTNQRRTIEAMMTG
jgi:hypothetical protein